MHVLRVVSWICHTVTCAVFKSLKITSKTSEFVNDSMFLWLWPICLSLLSPQDVEECQLSECGAEEELGGGDATLQRSSSTSDINQQLSDSFPGTVTLTLFLVFPKINEIVCGRFEKCYCGIFAVCVFLLAVQDIQILFLSSVKSKILHFIKGARRKTHCVLLYLFHIYFTFSVTNALALQSKNL